MYNDSNYNKKFLQIKPILILSSFIVLFFSSCKRNPQELKIKEAIRTGDYMTVAALCSAYQFPDYKTECESSLEQADQEIQNIISRKQEMPFMKLILDPDKGIKIQELLKANIQMGIKYRSIWNETAEIYKE
ncbi:MAG TPA: hypothetical protein PKL30_09520 [Leptospiraceae bacterium]|nr:hypothetical protein [Leptospiraceae bacterium]HNC00313.1 hypothetical protein [Leptospiraceae bacterium]HNC54786.1 hypothetical protein [Leptospiraceae bacterium]HNE11561.1 hypothetical protein [Leptospiraceae bacterium]HNF55268.1 hypothetical protein [Leptospiraceae bacterium]